MFAHSKTPLNLPARDNRWLLCRLDNIWSTHFSDVTQANRVFVRFGRSSKTRFGSIRLRYSDNSTHIMISGIFKKHIFPEEVVDHTIAHELVHYTHGFSSPHSRLHKFPHRGGIIDKELKRRGLGALVAFYRKWLDEYAKTL